MTNEEKVLAVWLDARAVHITPGKWLIAHGNDPENPGYAPLGPEFDSEEAAWQNAAESLLPQQIESIFDKWEEVFKDPRMDDSYSLCEPVAPVEAKEKEAEDPKCILCGDTFAGHYQLGNRKVCFNKNPEKMAIITGNYFTPSEPKPTPSTTASADDLLEATERLIERYQEALTEPATTEIESKALHLNMRTLQKLAKRFAKPQPDSSSIPEKTFGEWWNTQGRLFMAGDDIHVQRAVMGVCERAWNAAKGQR